MNVMVDRRNRSGGAVPGGADDLFRQVLVWGGDHGRARDRSGCERWWVAAGSGVEVRDLHRLGVEVTRSIPRGFSIRVKFCLTCAY